MSKPFIENLAKALWMREVMLRPPRQPLLASSYEKFFRVVELVDVGNDVTRDPPDPIGGDSSAFKLFWSQPPYLSGR